jgi:hypothetical protein
MDRALTRVGAPDVVRSAIGPDQQNGASGGRGGGKISARTIDKLFGIPDKIHIPERYKPESVSPMSKRQRSHL